MFVVGVIGGILGMLIGFLYWVRSSGTKVYVEVWSAVILFFMIVMIIAFYVGGKSRIR